MANEEHINIIKFGASVWNKWREENDGITPDFSGADLKYKPLFGTNLRDGDLSNTILTKVMLAYANLESANLNNAELMEASLVGANLSMADISNANLDRAILKRAVLHGTNLESVSLREANLTHADLSNANLRRADLSTSDLLYTNFRGVDLRDTNLTKANFTEASLRDADLYGADLNGAVFDGTICSNTNLSNTKNIDKCRHRGPSILDHRTILKSGKIPNVFMRGCGLPDSLIEYYPSILTEPIQFYSCFISYSSNDEEIAERLFEDLQNNGVRCWFGPKNMRIGDKIRTTIDESIRVYDKLLIILSKNSINSKWVEHEVETALDFENERGQQILLPIRLDDSVMESRIGWTAKIRREWHIGDFKQWRDPSSYTKAFERLLRDLKTDLIDKRILQNAKVS